jgi:glutamate-1-semialdehyde aminotransferase
VHFTSKTDLVDYRDTLADDSERLQRFLYLAMEEGVILVPDGRIYLSTVHDDRDIEETLAASARVFAKL